MCFESTAADSIAETSSKVCSEQGIRYFPATPAIQTNIYAALTASWFY